VAISPYEVAALVVLSADRLFGSPPTVGDYQGFVADPLVRWVESTVGLAEVGGRLVRAEPRTLRGDDGIAAELAKFTSTSQEDAAEALRAILIAGSRVLEPSTGRPIFAFKLHQFVSRGSSVYATVEPEDDRVVTLTEQPVPGRNAGTGRGSRPGHRWRACRS
jgi:hypothetical protein